MRRVLMDIAPLKESPAYRRWWIGSGLSTLGSQMTSFAVALQVYELTHSSLAVGGVGLVVAVPSIVFGLAGGAIADGFDRRKLVLAASGGLAVVSALFTIQAFADLRSVWLLYCLVAMQALLNVVNAPATGTFLARLLPAHLVPAGAALRMFAFHGSMTVGPALAGVVVAAWGLKACYLVDAISFAAALYAVARLPAMPPDGAASRPRLKSVLDGLRFVRGSKIITGALLVDMNATILGMPFAVFPAINAGHFGGAAQTLGLLTAAPAVGGLLGSALSGSVGRVSPQGLAMLIAAAVWGAALAAFGFANSFWLALVLLAIAGAADVTSVVFRASMIQLATPDQYRGRVSAADYVVGAACPQLGNFRAGTIGSLATPAISVISGGFATVLGTAAIGVLLPAFTHYRVRQPA